MTGGLKMGVNVTAHTRHIFLRTAPSLPGLHSGYKLLQLLSTQLSTSENNKLSNTQVFHLLYFFFFWNHEPILGLFVVLIYECIFMKEHPNMAMKIWIPDFFGGRGIQNIWPVICINTWREGGLIFVNDIQVPLASLKHGVFWWWAHKKRGLSVTKSPKWGSFSDTDHKNRHRLGKNDSFLENHGNCFKFLVWSSGEKFYRNRLL